VGTHLAIDAVGAKFGGAVVVATRAVAAALSHPRVDKVTVFSSPQAERRFTWPASPRLEVVEPEVFGPSAAWLVYWKLHALSKATLAAGAERLLCLSNAGIGPPKVNTTLFIHQSLPFSSEAMAQLRWRQRARVYSAQWLTYRSALRSARTLVQTATMRSWVSRDFSVPPQSVCIVPHEPDRPLAVEASRTTDLLYVGSDALHKNIDFLGPALRHCAEAGQVHRLCCTLPAEHPVVKRWGFQPLGYLSGEQLWHHYARAHALIFPSIVETVGLPLVEAMQAGLPILAADRPYAREVCGAAALYFDPNDPTSLAQPLTQLRDPGVAQRLVAEGRLRVREFEEARGYQRMIDLALQ
jgi:glycosyltransferase involved in cell wall biosynthesis